MIVVNGTEQPRKAGPELRADTGDILYRLGLGEAEIAALRAKGVVKYPRHRLLTVIFFGI